VYVHATEVGGTHPALIEAMGAGNCVLAYDTPENREVVGDCGMFFSSVQSLVERMQFVLTEPDQVRTLGRRAQARVREQYSWDSVTDSYERLFRELHLK
jgi:glycosyltransferase involved in cell wall biosynthesis